MNLTSMIPELLSALPLTLGIMFVAMIVGFFLALIATVFRVRRIPVISQFVDLYVSYARSVPVVLQLFVAFYGLPLVAEQFGFSDFVTANIAAMIGLSLYHGGYLSEVMRPAFLAVESGQHDAADSMGYSFRQKMLRIVGPQAVHYALPGYGNAIIYLIHNVALVMYIGAADVMATAHLIMERDYNQYQFGTYLVLAVLYSLLCGVAWLIIRFFEQRHAKYSSKTAARVKFTSV
ncbi:amino acid ABC transporter permease [Pantoea sp. B9002]|uniref:L-cystine transport system permease protein n=4 Tax=Pantoea TaxID=53335 RepID=A0A1I3VCL9_9GAMM|nr:amino acid ABC transporter permease [Pantoea sp. PNT02]MBD9660983.1 amino acid ABC transporter permease [Pantoea sp. PNT03]MRS19660.1 ABC transporter permease subunit [Enterobacteriaceae bacterium RIT692]MRT24342.1 ABC transporter permease subunit [Enterobacteriaceae bacterium RIT697]MRT41514.1 ABC transporter permease subunit [Enterobacteriaceae bacterium RIT702]NWA61365.1 amino acid ABC transporter permease [Pantoea sp. B9002]PLR25356.1 amino acid ABC transporter permease [Pantoea endoph